MKTFTVAYSNTKTDGTDTGTILQDYRAVNRFGAIRQFVRDQCDSWSLAYYVHSVRLNESMSYDFETLVENMK